MAQLIHSDIQKLEALVKAELDAEGQNEAAPAA
jgi:hypothetical protein